MNIDRILLIIIIIYLIISHCKIWFDKSIYKNNIENFAVTDDIKGAIKEIYNSDMESVRQLAIMSQKLLAGGLEIPGNVKITGNLEVSGAIKSSGAINSSSEINSAGAINSGGNIQSKGEIKTVDIYNNEKTSLNSVLTSLNSINSTITSSISSINTNLGNKIDNNASISLEKKSIPSAKLSTVNGSVVVWSQPSIMGIPMTYDWTISRM